MIHVFIDGGSNVTAFGFGYQITNEKKTAKIPQSDLEEKDSAKINVIAASLSNRFPKALIVLSHLSSNLPP